MKILRKYKIKNRKWHLIVATLTFVTIFTSCVQKSKTIDLTGEWTFQIDTANIGITEKWYKHTFTETVQLPGSMRDNNKGFEPSLTTQWTGSIYDSSWYFNPALEKYRTEKPLKFPFWLTPNRHYVGAAWYQKEVNIPKSWSGQEIQLILERPHWESTIWVDTVEVTHQNSLSAPHEANLSRYLNPGKHIITIRIDNRLDEVNVGPDSHSVTDHTQGNWNGIVGKMELQVKPSIYIKGIQLYPNIETKEVEAKIVIQNHSNFSGEIELLASAISLAPAISHRSNELSKTIQIKNETDTFSLVLPMGDNVLLWDEFTPNLYVFNTELLIDGKVTDSLSTNFGMRKISTNEKEILVNNRPTYFRGNVDCCVFPLTGYPPTDVESWLKVFKQTKAYGLNHVRFHSWCPPEAAFDAADQLGIYLQPEGPSWANHGTSLGRNEPIDKYIYEETQRILNAYGNHPSFVMFAYGNEPRGNYVNFLNEYLRYWKANDNRRIYTGASIGGSWTECEENEFHVKGGARGLPWKSQPNSAFKFEKNIERFNVPFITHELGQYCVYPNFDEISKYTGVLKAYNFEMFRELLENNHMGNQAHDFLMASGELQKICYKYEIEASQRTNGMVGYQLLGLNDFPGQGTALVGILDAFFEEKGYATANDFKTFCNPVNILAALQKLTFTNHETFAAEIELANYGLETISNKKLNWKIIDENEETIIADGVLSVSNLNIGQVDSIGEIQIDLNNLNTATKLTLKCELDSIKNSWDFWVYPQELPEITSTVLVTDTLNESAINKLKEGGKVLLLTAGKVENGKDVVQYFTPVFWNTSWFKMRPPHTTGILVKNEHPIFKHFPTEFHSNLQWWDITNQQQVMNLENFPAEFRPLIQPIDTWFLNRRLGMLWEAKVGNGQLVVCSADLRSNIVNRPVAKQLLYSIESYMNSTDFKTEFNVELETVKELFEIKDRTAIDLHTKNSPDELIPGKK